MSTNSFARARAMESTDACHLSLLSSNHVPETEIEQYYPNDVYGRAKLLCLSAAHQVNIAARLRSSSKDAKHRSEALMKADKLLQKAFAIASKEQVVAIARAHLLFEKGEKQTAEKILDSRVGDEGRRERQHRGDVVEGRDDCSWTNENIRRV